MPYSRRRSSYQRRNPRAGRTRRGKRYYSRVTPKRGSRPRYSYKRAFRAGSLGASILKAPSSYNKLTFQDNWTLTGNGVDISKAYAYDLSSLFDPYYALGGDTVEGYDTLTNIWDHYIVNGAKVSISATITSGSENQIYSIYGIVFSSALIAGGYTIPTYDEYTEQSSNNVVFRNHMPGVTYSQPHRWKKYWSLNKVEQTKRNSNLEQYSAVTNGDPAKQSIIYIGFCTQDDSAIVNNCVLHVSMRITYYAKMFSRVPNLN